jgi:hypothetical protein
MTNLSHIMPKPKVVPIFWGHAYAEFPDTAKQMHQMLKDLVLGPFMNGLVQYGVQKATLVDPYIFDDLNSPAKLVWTNQQGTLVDDITGHLIGWIKDGHVPAPRSENDTSQLYLIFPPTDTVLEIYNDPTDPIGNAIQGFHNEGEGIPAGPQTYYWSIVKTADAGDPSTTAFVNGVSRTMCHEIVEQCADIDGSWGEVGDTCVDDGVTYRGWSVQQYWSAWDLSCQSGDSPVSVKKFLKAVGFDYKNKSLRTFGMASINLNSIALKMQGQPAPAAPPGY